MLEILMIIIREKMKIGKKLGLGLFIGCLLLENSFAKAFEPEAKNKEGIEILCECKNTKDSAKCLNIALNELKFNKYMDLKTKIKIHKEVIEELQDSLAILKNKRGAVVEMEDSVDNQSINLYENMK